MIIKRNKEIKIEVIEENTKNESRILLFRVDNKNFKIQIIKSSDTNHHIFKLFKWNNGWNEIIYKIFDGHLREFEEVVKIIYQQYFDLAVCFEYGLDK